MPKAGAFGIRLSAVGAEKWTLDMNNPADNRQPLRER